MQGSGAAAALIVRRVGRSAREGLDEGSQEGVGDQRVEGAVSGGWGASKVSKSSVIRMTCWSIICHYL